MRTAGTEAVLETPTRPGRADQANPPIKSSASGCSICLLKSAEIYDPVKDLWTAVPDMLAINFATNAATLMEDGKVFVAASWADPSGGLYQMGWEIFDRRLSTTRGAGTVSSATRSAM